MIEFNKEQEKHIEKRKEYVLEHIHHMKREAKSGDNTEAYNRLKKQERKIEHMSPEEFVKFNRKHTRSYSWVWWLILLVVIGVYFYLKSQGFYISLPFK